MRIISSLATLKELAGTEIAVSDWFEVDQARIERFADATGDHQWIHVDQERAARESPFGGTVAHGFLTLSLIPMMMENTFRIETAGFSVNYGVNKVRFPAPLRTGSRVRAKIALAEIHDVEGGAQMIWGVTVEAEGVVKPVCTAELITRHYGGFRPV